MVVSFQQTGGVIGEKLVPHRTVGSDFVRNIEGASQRVGLQTDGRIFAAKEDGNIFAFRYK